MASALMIATGCGSSTRIADRDGGTSDTETSTTAPRIDAPTSVGGFPAATGIASAVLSGTTAWVLTTGDHGALSVLQAMPAGSFRTVVKADALSDMNPSTVSIAAWPSGFIIMGERCDDRPQVAECTKDSGLVKLFDDSGELVAAPTLWEKRPTEAGGDAPRFIGLHGRNAWIQGLDGIVEIDPEGKIVAKIPRPDQTQPCAQDDDLHGVTMKAPELPSTSADGSPHAFTAEELKKLPPASISMERWTGSDWAPVSNGTLANAGTSTDLNCQGGAFTLWSSEAVNATWTAKGGWAKAPKASEALHQGTNMSGQLAPTFASNGAIYRLGDDFHLRRLDTTTGQFVDTGMVLEPETTNTKAIISVTVAESGPNLFACAGRYSGLPGGPTTPGTVCGFAPVPT